MGQSTHGGGGIGTNAMAACRGSRATAQHGLERCARVCLLALVSLAIVLVTLLFPNVPAHAAPPLTPFWMLRNGPNVGTATNILSGVAAISPSDVWSVGNYLNTSAGAYQTLIEQWNGASWSVATSPNVGTLDNSLNAVAAVSAGDVWTVGSSNTSASAYQTLIERWNGTTWSVVSSPNVGTRDILFGVAAVSANDVWAVGSYTSTSTGLGQTLIEQWNGTSWSVVPSPNVSSANNNLNWISAISANDVWVVGYAASSSTGQGQTLAEHWNGSVWSIVPSPNVGTNSNILLGAVAVATNDVWAVGYYVNTSINAEQTLIEQWNGTSWSVVASPNAGTHDNVLFGVAAVSATGTLWAVGYTHAPSPGVYQTLTEQWDGTAWSVVASPNSSASYNILYAVSAVSPHDIWAVGNYNTGLGIGQALDERCCNYLVGSAPGGMGPLSVPRPLRLK